MAEIDSTHDMTGREAFEAWAGHAYDLEWVDGRGYASVITACAFDAWRHQAGRISDLERGNRLRLDVIEKIGKESIADSERIAQLEAQVQALRDDAERVDWLESSTESHGFCHTGNGDYRYYAHQEAGYKTAREVIDAARAAKG